MFKKDNKDIVVLKQTKPGECGGTDATQDKRAPKEIKSEEMILFEATSALNTDPAFSDEERQIEPIGYVSAFAAPAGSGTFLFLEKGAGFWSDGERSRAWAYVKEDLFPRLVKLVREENLARKNGFHSTTHGLPQNFGGRVYVCYASGEKISFSDNQAPIFSAETGRKIVNLFTEVMQGETVKLPAIGSLKEIRFSEERDNGGFTKATLTLHADGTGTNKKSSRYDDPTVYENEKPVDAETVAAIQKNIADTGILAWAELPQRERLLNRKKEITFLFEDGRAITVEDNKVLPDSISGGFFNIELEIITKH